MNVTMSRGYLQMRDICTSINTNTCQCHFLAIRLPAPSLIPSLIPSFSHCLLMCLWLKYLLSWNKKLLASLSLPIPTSSFDAILRLAVCLHYTSYYMDVTMNGGYLLMRVLASVLIPIPVIMFLLSVFPHRPSYLLFITVYGCICDWSIPYCETDSILINTHKNQYLRCHFTASCLFALQFIPAK